MELYSILLFFKELHTIQKQHDFLYTPMNTIVYELDRGRIYFGAPLHTKMKAETNNE